MRQITLKIESQLDAVPLLGQVVCFVCSTAGLPAVEGNEVEVCVVEAVNNSIKHAYGGEPAHTVEVEITILEDQLVFDVWDSGKSADSDWIHSDHRDALNINIEHLEEVSESGRGLAIIQQVMNSFEYTPGTERNRFRLTKRLKG